MIFLINKKKSQMETHRGDELIDPLVTFTWKTMISFFPQKQSKCIYTTVLKKIFLSR